MKDIFHYLYLFIIAALLVWCMQLSCNRGKTSPAGVVSIVTTKTIDTVYGDIKYIPVPFAIHDTITDSFETSIAVPYEVEKIREILVNSKAPIVKYMDTLYLDTSGRVFLDEEVHGLLNRRNFKYEIYNRNSTTTVTPKIQKTNKVLLGLDYIYPSNYIGIGGAFQLKNDNQIQARFGYLNNQKQYGLSYYFKIKLK